MNQMGSWLQASFNLSTEEKELLVFLLSDSLTLQYSTVSPRFRNAEQESLASLLPDFWPILKDAYLAYAGILKALHPGCATDVNADCNLRHVASAMVALRSLPVSNIEDAELCITLGFALAWSVYAAIGVGVSDICHYCLTITRPFIETTAIIPEKEPRISFLVLLETMECVVYRRRPTLKIQLRATTTVDRYLGLCLSLLPLFYDICVISHCLAGNTDVQLISLQQQLKEVQTQVEKWQPANPEGFLHEFSTAGVVQLLAQARVYRLAALLLIHRLQYAFGQRDSQADVWSREVMVELELARRISNQPVRFVTLPFIVAAVEVRDPAERDDVARNVDVYVDQFTPVVQRATRAFFSRVWHERDMQKNCSWLDSIHKPCVVLDSILGSFPS